MKFSMMPDTAFALWQGRLGLSRAVDAAAALNISRQAVGKLRDGTNTPSGSTSRLMEILEEQHNAKNGDSS